MKVSGRRDAPTGLSPGGKHGTHWTGGWAWWGVRGKIGEDRCERHVSCCTGPEWTQIKFTGQFYCILHVSFNWRSFWWFRDGRIVLRSWCGMQRKKSPYFLKLKYYYVQYLYVVRTELYFIVCGRKIVHINRV